MKSNSEKLLCFDVPNLEELYERDHLAIESLEAALAEAGALPAKIDSTVGVVCVTVTNLDLTIDGISKILREHGCHPALKGDNG